MGLKLPAALDSSKDLKAEFERLAKAWALAEPKDLGLLAELARCEIEIREARRQLMVILKEGDEPAALYTLQKIVDAARSQKLRIEGLLRKEPKGWTSGYIGIKKLKNQKAKTAGRGSEWGEDLIQEAPSGKPS